MEKRLFTSECVTTGHPDKVADRISDSILDACLAQDPNSRVACETLVTTDFCCISGEITTSAAVDYEAIARQVIRDIGYTRPEDGFCADTVEIQCRIHTQSPDIALGTNDQVGGAGDQGMMFGGACNQTPELMPLAGAIARALTNRLTQMVAENPHLRPDGKAQVTVEFDEAGRPVGVETVVVSIMHSPDFAIENLRQYVKEMVIAPVLAGYGFDIRDVDHIYINPTGKFVVGGPAGDTGLTGRKIIVDTYGTGRIGDDALTELLRRTFHLTPAGIIKTLDLRRPIFAETAARGHFGMEKDRPWEKTDRAQELLRLAGI